VSSSRAGRQTAASCTRSAADRSGLTSLTFCSGMSACAEADQGGREQAGANSVFGRFRNKFRVWQTESQNDTKRIANAIDQSETETETEPSQLWVAVNSGGSGMSASETSCQTVDPDVRDTHQLNVNTEN
jgi:hypothetical protein